MKRNKGSKLRVALIIIAALSLVVAFQNCGRANSSSFNDSSIKISSLNDPSPSDPLPLFEPSPQADIPPVNTGGTGDCESGKAAVEALFLNIVDTQGLPAIPKTPTKFTVWSATESMVFKSYKVIDAAAGTIAIPMYIEEIGYKIEILSPNYLMVKESIYWDILCEDYVPLE